MKLLYPIQLLLAKLLAIEFMILLVLYIVLYFIIRSLIGILCCLCGCDGKDLYLDHYDDDEQPWLCLQIDSIANWIFALFKNEIIECNHDCSMFLCSYCLWVDKYFPSFCKSNRVAVELSEVIVHSEFLDSQSQSQSQSQPQVLDVNPPSYIEDQPNIEQYETFNDQHEIIQSESLLPSYDEIPPCYVDNETPPPRYVHISTTEFNNMES